MGKTDKRLHDRTKAPDMADRWAATFAPKPKPSDEWPGWDNATDEQKDALVKSFRRYPHEGRP